MYYEFGIFSTIIYGCEVMPNWIWLTDKGPSISFIIPSSCNNIRGLNFCYVQRLQDEFPVNQSTELPWIKISNLTKDYTWIYNHYCKWVDVDAKCLTFVSHWMFRMNEMEAGDLVTVTVKDIHEQLLIRTSGVSFVYDDEDCKEEEEDVLGYYKSWNHIIGGDLSPFQLTTGEYCLELIRFTGFPFTLNPFIDFAANDYKEPIMYFKAFSQRKSNIRGRAIEDVTK